MIERISERIRHIDPHQVSIGTGWPSIERGTVVRCLQRALVLLYLVSSVTSANELRLFVVNAHNGDPAATDLSVIRAADGAKLTDISFPTTTHGSNVAVHPNGLKAYVTGENFAITVIDTLTNTVIGDISTPENLSSGIAFLPTGNEALVAMRTGNVVRRIDTVADSLVGSPIATSTSPSAIVVRSNGTRAYVGTLSTIDVIDLTLPTPAVIHSISLGAGASTQELDFNSDESLLYLTDNGSDQLRAFRTSDNLEVTPGFWPTMDEYPRSLSISADNALAFVGLRFGLGEHSIWAVRLSDGVIVQQIYDPDPFVTIGNPRKSVLSPDGSRLYVTCHSGWYIAEIDTAESCYRYIDASSNPVGIAIAEVPVGGNIDADLDPTFDGDGRVQTAVGTGSSKARAVAVQSDGKIVAVGIGNSESDMAIARYNDDGSLDTSFSGDGKDLQDFGIGVDRAWDVALQGDGKIVVVGSAAAVGSQNFKVLRYLSDGTLEGHATATFAGASVAHGVAIQSDGRIVVVGSTDAGSAIAVARFTTSGILDSTFSGDGMVTTDFFWGVDEGWDVAIQPGGKIIVVGSAAQDTLTEFVVLRYNVNGSLDTSFGSGGSTFVGFQNNSYGRAVAIQPDGKIVVVGSSSTSSAIAVARLNSSGSLDTTFACDGRDERDFFWGVDEGWDVAIRSDGKILVAGSVFLDTLSEIAVLRYNTDGYLDWSFGGDGYASTLMGQGSHGQGLALHADGKLIVAGYATAGNPSFFALARYEGWHDMVLDTGFEE